MEELSQMAMAYYQASDDHCQKLAHNFFNVMDHDGDGKIDRREFLEFMKEEGYVQMTNLSFFNQLDLDGNGTLDFVELMTVYYILKSGRPFCDNCKKFIPSTYLTCLGCLEDPTGGSFYLCLDCYLRQKCHHKHRGFLRFLDNYSLLEVMTNSKRSEAGSSKPSNNHTGDPSLAMLPYGTPHHVHNHHSSDQYASFAPPVQNNIWIQNNYYPPTPPIQNVDQRSKWREALEAMNAAIQIGAVSSPFCSIL